jgi:hypothetical protein
MFGNGKKAWIYKYSYLQGGTAFATSEVLAAIVLELSWEDSQL